MNSRDPIYRWLSLILGWMLVSAARAQVPAVRPSAEAPLFRDLALWALAAPAEGLAPPPRAPRVRLLRMPAAYLTEPIGLEGDLDPPPDQDAPVKLPFQDDVDFGRIQVAMGDDRPFFDFRRPGAPGGVGFYRLNTQLSLFEGKNTGCALACQAVTPAGVEWNGVNEGPTFLSPALTLFHHLGDGTALHGFVSTDVRANTTWKDNLGRSVHYGVALQQPVPGLTTDSARGLFFVMEALGRYRDVGEGRPGSPHAWELLPGVHYRLSDDWWLSSGLVVPVGPVRDVGFRQWHFAASWRF